MTALNGEVTPVETRRCSSRLRIFFFLAGALVVPSQLWAGDHAPGADHAAARSVIPETIAIPAGPFLHGSRRGEREAGYLLDEAAYGHRITRENRWYESEMPLGEVDLPSYEITRNLITHEQYAAFVRASGHPPPGVSARQWEGYGLIHPFSSTRRFAWVGSTPPPGREHHPVVLIALSDARTYARWLSTTTSEQWRLPSEIEWEKAARGVDGRRFPWGDKFDPYRLNSHDAGPYDTVPVGSFPRGRSPFGLLDAAGQVFEWTSTEAGAGRVFVKGGSWDDSGCGICRPAARHSRPVDLKHILIGFRLVRSRRLLGDTRKN